MKTQIKIWLDDVRPAPFGWVRCYFPDEVIRILESNEVSEISLDHDLGDDSVTGYAVLLWIEEQVHTNGYIPPKMFVHSANPVAKEKMLKAIEAIEERTRLQTAIIIESEEFVPYVPHTMPDKEPLLKKWNSILNR